jgi:hypothetical protein
LDKALAKLEEPGVDVSDGGNDGLLLDKQRSFENQAWALSLIYQADPGDKDQRAGTLQCWRELVGDGLETFRMKKRPLELCS